LTKTINQSSDVPGRVDGSKKAPGYLVSPLGVFSLVELIGLDVEVFNLSD